METETESEDHNKEQNTSEANKTTIEDETKAMEENIKNITEQTQEVTEGTDEDSEMLISDIRSEEMKLNEVLEKEGVNLPDMVENWKKKGMENISEEEVRKINEIFIAKHKVEINMQNKNLGIAKGMGHRTKSLLQTSTSSKRGRREGANPIMRHCRNWDKCF